MRGWDKGFVLRALRWIGLDLFVFCGLDLFDEGSCDFMLLGGESVEEDIAFAMVRLSG